MIEINGVDKHFGEVKALDHIVASIHEGSIFGMVGTNGAGKSTLLRIMSGVLEPDAGNVLLDGEEVYENPKAKAKICFLSDTAYFFPNATPKSMAEFYSVAYPAFSFERYYELLDKFRLEKKRKIAGFSKGMKKQISMLLATACAASLLAACGGSGSTAASASAADSTAASSEETAADAASLYENAQKPDKLVWWVHDGMHQEDGSEQWIADFDAKTGIDLELDFIDNNEYTKKLELAYASDTVPDTFDLNGETLGNYAAQGAIADLTDLVHESGLYDKVDKNLWDALTVNGKIYGVPRETPSAIVTYVRKDWLDRLGMDVPTTYDEFIEMLTRFKNEIPECTAPYTAPGLKSTQALPEFYQGATADYVKVDGKWVDGMAQDNMLTALQNLQDAYTAGLIDQEAITNTTSSCRDEWYAGTVGCFPYWGGLWGETLTVRLKQNVPDAEVIALPPIEGATYLYSAPSVQVISSKLSDEQVASVYKYFIEYMHDGGEGQVLFQSGVEGVHWQQSGNNIDPLPTISKPAEAFRKAWITPWLALTPMTATDKNVEVSQEVTDSLAVVSANAKNISVFPVSEQRTMITSDLTTTRENIISRVAMGQLTPEEGMAEYKAQAETLNVAQALEEMNANA